MAPAASSAPSQCQEQRAEYFRRTLGCLKRKHLLTRAADRVTVSLLNEEAVNWRRCMMRVWIAQGEVYN